MFIISVASALLIVKDFYSIKIQSSVRAYINGQAEYSKGRNNAAVNLINYLQTENLVYIAEFKKAIAIPLGDNIAGNNLLVNGDDSKTKAGFLAGKNHPADVSDMIWFYKTFSSFAFAQKAIKLWGAAAPHVNRLSTIGDMVQQLQQQGKLTPIAKEQLIEEIDGISVLSSEWESAFSRVLDDTASDIKIVLQTVNILLILLIMSISFLFVMKIINSLNKSESELKSTVIMLNDTNRELENFSYVASHDLKEPLRMVTNFLGLIEKKYNNQLDETGKTYIHFAVDGASRMKKLIDDLLEYSRTSINKITYETVDLNEVIARLRTDFQDVLDEPGAGLFAEAMPQIVANKLQMQQVLQNLVANAIKYRSKAAPQVHINASATADHWVFAVRDNGLGIEAEYFKTIFVIFQRLKTNKIQSGTGIGLALCKKIAERHGGEIWVESEPGKGSTFFFTVSKQL
ncbi:ATP-binding protein [Ferruginibacter paludis]|uniref:sensor histidine kinase n=1 Tax=Ferruginibacter paludis TaxID=1310417 RepID=UPI0025B49766|nr:ATP-binding protein [Ferruginibacter paludis]MDN3657048.1 ATP-binding protein [Ferruginibacter paludis]